MDEPIEHREINEVVSAIGEVKESVNALTNTLTPATISQLDLGARQSSHVRMRTTKLVISPSAAATITLTIGARTYPFTFAANAVAPIELDFVQIVDRGTDITLAASAGTVTGYLLYTPE